MTRFAHGVSIQVRRYRPGAVDSRGNPVDQWGPPVESPGWAVASTPASSEPAAPGHAELVATPLTLYGPHDADVGAHDLVVVDGVEYAVGGDPQRWANPHTGVRPGCVVVATRSEG